MNKRFEELMAKDNTRKDDTERKALFYIIAGNEELYNKVEHIYDFEQHMIKHDLLNVNEDSPAYLTEPSSTARKLLELGFNLFNPRNKADVCDTFLTFGDENFLLAMNAIRIRFKRL